MRKSFWRTVAYMVGGAILGTICGQLLAHQWSILGQHTQLQWSPSADLSFIRFALNLTIRINLLTVIGVIAGYILARRLK